MTEIFTPLSVWMQLASFFFTLSGVHGDLLVIRFFLFVAYIMLFLNSALGSPLWGSVNTPGAIAVDTLLWALLGLYVHGASLVRLILDERKVKLTEEQACLWRMFYRTGGLSARLFHALVVPHMQVVHLEPNVEIPTQEYFYIIYCGKVNLKVVDGVLDSERVLNSGEMFDIAMLGMFSEDSVFVETKYLRCRTVTKCTLYRFNRLSLRTLAHERFAKGVWQSLLINNLSYIVESFADVDVEAQSEEACDKIFGPLAKWERPKEYLAGSGAVLDKPIRHLFRYMRISFSAPWPFGGHPTGIRQTQLPPPAQRLVRCKSHQHPTGFHKVRSIIGKTPSHDGDE